MTKVPLSISVRLSEDETLEFEGECLARVHALNHDDSIRRQFSVYHIDGGEFVAERLDDPGTINVRQWAARCKDSAELYEFFGNEPLANYLYGSLNIDVPGLRQSSTL